MNRNDSWRERREYRKNCLGSGKNNIGAGLIILLIGAALLAREVGFPLPGWFFTWPMILVAIGLFIGVSNRFRDFGWLIVTGIGFFFLADDIWPDFSFRNFLFPIIFIAIGLMIIFKPRSSSQWWKGDRKKESDGAIEDADAEYFSEGETVKADVLDVAAIFGAVKKNIVSKDFRGGEIVSVFGGADINLSQADFKRPQIVIESVNIFGGAKLIIPANWQIRSEAVAIFGGIEDKRSQVIPSEPEKILVLQGFVMFGGIEIKSF